VQDLQSLPILVSGAEGQTETVPLGQVARVTQAVGPARIDHLDRERVIAVQANTQARPLSEVIADIEDRLAGVQFPPGCSVRQGGET
jgi:HAE1 family hydrophobic/amphiphilic exporter-1